LNLIEVLEVPDTRTRTPRGEGVGELVRHAADIADMRPTLFGGL
jgi:hypothetical protein